MLNDKSSKQLIQAIKKAKVEYYKKQGYDVHEDDVEVEQDRDGDINAYIPEDKLRPPYLYLDTSHKSDEDYKTMLDKLSISPGIVMQEEPTIQASNVAAPINNDINFNIDDQPIPILQLKDDGSIYVRGQKVDDNKVVYAAFKDWLQRSGYNV